MEKIASFTVNHIDLLAGIYVSRKDYLGRKQSEADRGNGETDSVNILTTFDLRFTMPNREPVMDTAGVHTIEHLGATFLRNHPVWRDRVIYFGPMGCRTGFYLLLRDSITREEALALVKRAFVFISDYEGKIPGSERKECGNYAEHDLEGAKAVARDMLDVLKNRTAETMNYL